MITDQTYHLVLSVFVPGHPRTAGSKRVVTNRRTGKPLLLDSSGPRGEKWRKAVEAHARKAWGARDLIRDQPVRLGLTFVLPRPKAHYRADETLKTTAPSRVCKKPDVGKMARLVEDALTGIVYQDDALIAVEVLQKVYGERPGVHINVEVFDAEEDDGLYEA